MGRGILNFLTFAIIAVLIGSAIINAGQVAKLVNSVSSFMSTTFAAELGAVPKGKFQVIR